MMNNFQIIYKILHTLERAMDYPEYDISQLDYKRETREPSLCLMKGLK